MSLAAADTTSASGQPAPSPTRAERRGKPLVLVPLPGGIREPGHPNGHVEPVTSAARRVRHLLARRLITLAVLSVGGVTLLLAVPGLRDVVAELRHVSGVWVIAAIALEIASCLSFVIVFRRFFPDLPTGLSRKVAWTEMGSGALLPGGGAGSLAIGGWLLHLTGMEVRQIVRRSSGLFFLTSAVNVAALIAGGVLLFVVQPPGVNVLLLAGLPVVLGLVALSATLAIPPLVDTRPSGTRARPGFVELVDGIRVAEDALRHASWRDAGAVGYLAFDIAVLAATLTAFGYAPPLPVLLLSYIIGYLANLIPVPGGVGVLEGGLAGTLILYGAPPVQTAAGVLVYHAIAFWIPTLGGLWAYALLRPGLA